VVIRTNDRGRNFRLVTAPVGTPGREFWTELIPHCDGVMIEEIDLFAGFFTACEREEGCLGCASGASTATGLKLRRRARSVFPSRPTAPSRT